MKTNVIYNMDNIEGLQDKIDDNSIDLTVTSPPYDDLRTYDGVEWEFEQLAKELYRVTKEGGVIIWVIKDAVKDGDKTGSSFKQVLRFKDIGFNLYDTLIYKKSASSLPHDGRYLDNFEYMFVLSIGRPKTINLLQDHKNKQSGAKKTGAAREKDGTITKKPRREYPEYSRRFTIWEYSVGWGGTTSDKFAFDHPAMFPEKLAKDHIKSWSNDDNIVLDPFMGSGTTAKMAKKLDRKYIGFELNKEYYEIAQKRVSEVQKELI